MDAIIVEVDVITDSSVEVKIFDQVYNLRGSDPEYMVELAEYVEAKMRAIGEQNDMFDSVQLAVLAALNIADEGARLRTQLENAESRRSPKPLSEEERQRNRERRQRHYTKRSYDKQLLAMANDESLPAKERHEALFRVGKLRGYYRRPPAKR